MHRSALALIAVFILCGPVAAAPITLADYLVPGTTATVGSTTFSDFALLPPTLNFSTPIAPASVLVTPFGVSAGGPGLDFVFTANNVAGPLDAFELQVQYRVTNPAITSTQLALNGAGATGDGAVTGVIESVGANPVPPEIAFAIAGLAEPVVGSSFPAVGSLTVQNGFIIDGGTNGTGRLASAQFSAAAPDVPEPATAVMAGLLAVGMAVVRRRGAGRPGRAVVV